MNLSLHEWQSRFREMNRGRGDAASLFAEVSGASQADRIQVYRQGYWLRISESLLEDFPLSERLLGYGEFLERIRSFLQRKNSCEIELGELSDAFADFLLHHAPSSTLSRAVQIDLLAIEARRSPELEPVMQSCIFGLHPSVRFWEQGLRAYVLWRQEGVVYRERVSLQTLRLLRCFQVKESLEEITVRLEKLGQQPAIVQESVAEWARLGVIASYSRSGESR